MAVGVFDRALVVLCFRFCRPFGVKILRAGPYGSVDRFDRSKSLDGSTSQADVMNGFFERSISLFR